MWTPKRMLILIAGTFLFVVGFVVYDYFLGGYDGLPPLPDGYEAGIMPEHIAPHDEEDTRKKIRNAWGVVTDEKHESRRKSILDLASKSMLLAVDQFDIEPDGRVKLSPFSVALFPKKKLEPGAFPEINTIQCEIAYLTLDRPVQNFTELSSRRIIGVELRGSRGVTIINNRRTQEKNDDIEVNITLAPVYYEERTNKIWSEGFVKLLDTASQPKPTEMNAKGLEMQLAQDSTPLRGKTSPAAKKGDGVGGVEYLILKSHVEMHLYMDSKNGFLGGGQEAPRPAPASATAAAAEKAHIIIKTRGSMHYDLTKEQAQFDSPAPAPDVAPGHTDPVIVAREHKVGPKDSDIMVDQLTCDSLLLTFRKKAPVAAGAAADTGPRDSLGGDKEIESALALARPGGKVTLAMDTENLEAEGTELFYACATAKSGPHTVLKGSPLEAIREGSILKCVELHLFGADKNGKGQHTIAKGPGKIDLLNKTINLGMSVQEPKNVGAKNQDPKPADVRAAEKPRHTFHALWKDNLISIKDQDGARVFDLLTLTGDAKFLDDEHHQSLSGQRLQVWLEPMTGPEGSKQQATGGPRQKIHKVEAFERVTAQAPEMSIERCDHMIFVFKEVPAEDDQLPKALPPLQAAGKDPPATAPPTVELRPPQPETKTTAEPKTPAGAGANNNPIFNLPGNGKKDEPKKPFKLWADDVVAFVSTQGTKKQLQELVTEGNVHVRQEGQTPADKGVDITGDMLNLIYHPLGNRLLVYGTKREARMQVGEMTLLGPKIDIDQRANTAVVDGVGAMKMPSKTTFDGATPVKEGVYVTIHWNKHMMFYGNFAEFHGGVQAFQDQAAIKCQVMQVTLDRFVSFKEGQKDKENAKIEKLVCDKKVWVEDKTLSPEGKLTAYKRLIGTALDLDNTESRFTATGPGRTINIAEGGGDLSPQAPNQPKLVSQPKNPKANSALKFTRVDFESRMFGNQKPGGPKILIFYDNVEVHHQPGDDPDVQVNANEPPKDGFYMRCNNLHVSSQEREGKTFQYMIAQNNAFFRTPEFFGNADVIKYDQSQELVIFEGKNGNQVKLYKFGRVGEKPKLIQADKILYNRKTGTFDLGGGKVISSWLREADGPQSDPPAAVAARSCRANSMVRQSSIVARLHLDRQHEPLLGLGLVARHDRQVFAAHSPVVDLSLVRRGDG